MFFVIFSRLIGKGNEIFKKALEDPLEKKLSHKSRSVNTDAQYFCYRNI